MRITDGDNQHLTTTVEGYALIKLGGLNLMLLQDGIRTLESIADLEFKAPPANGVGWITFQRNTWPVYCLTEELRISETLPETYRICALLSIDKGFIGLVCDEVILTAKKEITLHPVPGCMLAIHSPITALVHFGESMACVTSPQRLADFLSAQATGIDHKPGSQHG